MVIMVAKLLSYEAKFVIVECVNYSRYSDIQ